MHNNGDMLHTSLNNTLNGHLSISLYRFPNSSFISLFLSLSQIKNMYMYCIMCNLSHVGFCYARPRIFSLI